MSAIQDTGVYQLYYTKNPKAIDVDGRRRYHPSNMFEQSIFVHEVRFIESRNTDDVYVRAVSMDQIEIGNDT